MHLRISAGKWPGAGRRRRGRRWPCWACRATTTRRRTTSRASHLPSPRRRGSARDAAVPWRRLRLRAGRWLQPQRHPRPLSLMQLVWLSGPGYRPWLLSVEFPRCSGHLLQWYPGLRARRVGTASVASANRASSAPSGSAPSRSAFGRPPGPSMATRSSGQQRQPAACSVETRAAPSGYICRSCIAPVNDRVRRDSFHWVSSMTNTSRSIRATPFGNSVLRSCWVANRHVGAMRAQLEPNQSIFDSTTVMKPLRTHTSGRPPRS
jgi:hypothetical protein